MQAVWWLVSVWHLIQLCQAFVFIIVSCCVRKVAVRRGRRREEQKEEKEKGEEEEEEEGDKRKNKGQGTWIGGVQVNLACATHL